MTQSTQVAAQGIWTNGAAVVPRRGLECIRIQASVPVPLDVEVCAVETPIQTRSSSHGRSTRCLRLASGEVEAIVDESPILTRARLECRRGGLASFNNAHSGAGSGHSDMPSISSLRHIRSNICTEEVYHAEP